MVGCWWCWRGWRRRTTATGERQKGFSASFQLFLMIFDVRWWRERRSGADTMFGSDGWGKKREGFKGRQFKRARGERAKQSLSSRPHTHTHLSDRQTDRLTERALSLSDKQTTRWTSKDTATRRDTFVERHAVTPIARCSLTFVARRGLCWPRQPCRQPPLCYSLVLSRTPRHANPATKP